jgi:hypothetical protein
MDIEFMAAGCANDGSAHSKQNDDGWLQWKVGRFEFAGYACSNYFVD